MNKLEQRGWVRKHRDSPLQGMSPLKLQGMNAHGSQSSSRGVKPWSPGANAEESIKWMCITVVSRSINCSFKKMLLIKSIILFNLLQIEEERLLS